MIPQSQTQRHLDQRFSELGGSVLRGVRLLDLAPEFPGSAATVVDSNGKLRVINARFVAGCDGLHSRVRDQLGIGFPGTSPAQMSAVADVKFEDWPSNRVEISFSFSPHGMLISSPMPNHMVRMVASVAPGTPVPTQHDIDELIQTRAPEWLRYGKVKRAAVQFDMACPRARRHPVPARQHLPFRRRRPHAQSRRRTGNDHRISGRGQPGVEAASRAGLGRPNRYLTHTKPSAGPTHYSSCSSPIRSSPRRRSPGKRSDRCATTSWWR